MPRFLPCPTHSLGIDLGTTTSRYFWIDNGKSQHETDSARPIRSLVAPHWDEKHSRYAWTTGHKLLDLPAYARFKLKIGSLVPEPEFGPGAYGPSADVARPDVLAGHLLWAARARAVEDIPSQQRIRRVTITVPAEWDMVRRNATLFAARMAGFTDIRLIEEPVAAFLALRKLIKLESFSHAQNTLVLDLGGGTLDVVIIQAAEDRRRMLGAREQALPSVVARSMNDRHGGETIDDALCSVVAGARWAEIKERPTDKMRLTGVVRQLKEWLNPKDQAVPPQFQAAWPTMLSLDESHIVFRENELVLSLQDMTTAAQPLVNALRSMLDTVLHRAGLAKSDIEAVAFVGGSSYLRPVHNLIRREVFPGYEFGKELHLNSPEEVVAYGAALFQSYRDTGAKEWALTMPLDTSVSNDAEALDLLSVGTPVPHAPKFRRPVFTVPAGAPGLDLRISQHYAHPSRDVEVARVQVTLNSRLADKFELSYAIDENACLARCGGELLLHPGRRPAVTMNVADWFRQDPQRLVERFQLHEEDDIRAIAPVW